MLKRDGHPEAERCRHRRRDHQLLLFVLTGKRLRELPFSLA
jgi:hypothetical protein